MSDHILTDDDKRIYEAMRLVDMFNTEHFSNCGDVEGAAMGDLSAHFRVSMIERLTEEREAFGLAGEWQILVRGVCLGRYLEWRQRNDSLSSA